MPTQCKKAHVMVKRGCEQVKRVVYVKDGKKFVKLDGKEKLLSALRGKFRYTV